MTEFDWVATVTKHGGDSDDVADKPGKRLRLYDW